MFHNQYYCGRLATFLQLTTISPYQSESIVKSKKIITSLTNAYFIKVTFWTCLIGPFPAFNNEKLRHSYYSKQIATRDNSDVQSNDQEVSLSLSRTVMLIHLLMINW